MKYIPFLLLIALFACGKTSNSQTQKSLDEWKKIINQEDFQVVQQPGQLDAEMVKKFYQTYDMDLYALKNPNDNIQQGDSALIYAAKTETYTVVYFLTMGFSVSTTWLLIQNTTTDIFCYTGTPPFEYRSQPYKQAFKYFQEDFKNGTIQLDWFTSMPKK